MGRVTPKNKKRDESRMVKYFFDSYAVIEMMKGNANYSKYFEETILITIFNLVEIYLAVLKRFNEKKADSIYGLIKEHVVEIDGKIIKEAMKFKIKHKNEKLSYADCIGYVYAKKNQLVFLTGDKEFKNMKNVEFVK